MARTTKADYAKHYAEYQGKPEQIAKRSARNKARRAMVKKLGAVSYTHLTLPTKRIV